MRLRAWPAVVVVLWACGAASPPPAASSTTCPKPQVHPQLENGSFEEPKVKGGSFQLLGPPQPKAPPWTVMCQLGAWQLGGPLDLVSASGTDSKPADKDQFLDLDQHVGLNNSKVFSDLYQDVSTIPLVQYEITVMIAANANGDPPTKTAVLAAGGTQKTLTASIGKHTKQTLGWTTEKMTFTATSTTTRIELRSATPGDTGLLVDNVQMRMSSPILLIVVVLAVLLVGGGAVFFVFFIRRGRSAPPSKPPAPAP